MSTSAREKWLWRSATLAAFAGVIVTLAVGPYQLIFGSIAGSAAGTRYAPCLPGEEVAILDSPHIPEAQGPSVRYNSRPPTSGPHFAFTVSPGIYDEQIRPGLFVHAMEHGHVVIHYSPTLGAAEIDKLAVIARRYGEDVVLTPGSDLPSAVALTAWGRIDTMDRLDEARITDFIERLRGRYNHGWTRPADC
ncbi:MAG: DUF3105 domain-containing protein [Streptomyces sp.]|nr:DUF3105 domain-containing protein [Streptomyces sp.]NUP39222.1 DUF3105 domain-containing protein [Streptomyces sp.]